MGKVLLRPDVRRVIENEYTSLMNCDSLLVMALEHEHQAIYWIEMGEVS